MDDCYRIDICRNQLVDSEIPLLERVVNLYLGIKGETFNRAFTDEDILSFECELCVDEMQECLIALEEQGFKVNVKKLRKPKSGESEQSQSENAILGVHSLTYEDCQALLSNNENPINRLTKFKNWVVFGSCFFVVSIYLLMIYSSLI